MSVLLVEGEAHLRARLAALLAVLHGVRLLASVAEPAAAEACLAEQRPQLMLLDLMLPDAAALRLIARARSHGTRVILTRIFDSGADLAAALEAGAEGSVGKDASARELGRALGQPLPQIT